MFTGRTDAEASILWHLMWRVDSLETTLMMGKIEGKSRRGRQSMRQLRQHHRLKGHESEQTLGDSERQGSLACCSSWGRKQTQLGNWQQQQRQDPLAVYTYFPKATNQDLRYRNNIYLPNEKQPRHSWEGIFYTADTQSLQDLFY